jgi:flagellar biogenesis protein FliO
MSRPSDSSETHGVAFVSPENSLTHYSKRSANLRSAGPQDQCLYTPFVEKFIGFLRAKSRRRFEVRSLSLRSVCFLTALTVAVVAQAAQGQWQSKVPGRQTESGTQAAGHSSMTTVVPEGPAQGLQDPQVRPTGYTVAGNTLSVTGQQTADGDSSLQTTNTTVPPFIDLSDESLEPATVGTVEPTHTDMLIRLGTWTVIVMCLCGLTVLAIRRWQTKHGMLPVARGQSQIVETVVLGANRSISLVELRGVQALVGCDANGIQSIVPVPPAFPDILEDGEPGAAFSQSSDAHIESTA